jgi:haloalkane dehalogenase
MRSANLTRKRMNGGKLPIPLASRYLIKPAASSGAMNSSIVPLALLKLLVRAVAAEVAIVCATRRAIRRVPLLPWRCAFSSLLEALDVRERVTLVVHDWGSTLGFDWANRHRDAVKGIAYMEAMVGRQYWDHWDKFGMRPVLQALRSAAGEQMVLQENFFIEKILPGAMLRQLSDEEMTEYRRPFAEPGESRRPTLTWPREIPIEGDPADVTAIADAYADWLKTSSVPKLFLKAEPGGILAGGKVLEHARSLPAHTEVTVKGIHFVREDSPDEIGRAVASWMKTLS